MTSEPPELVSRVPFHHSGPEQELDIVAKKASSKSLADEHQLSTKFDTVHDYSSDATVKAMIDGIRQWNADTKFNDSVFDIMTRSLIQTYGALLQELEGIALGDERILTPVSECHRRLCFLKAYLTMGLLKQAVFQVFHFESSIAAMERHFGSLKSSDSRMQRILKALAKGRTQRQVEAAENTQQIRSHLQEIWRKHPDRNLTWVRRKLESDGVYSFATIKRYSAGLKRPE